MTAPQEPRALVKNAADPEQVGTADRKTKNTRQRELDDLGIVLGTAPGRRLLWRVMGYCGIFTSPFSSDVPTMAHAVGRQDVGRYLLSEINEAKPTAFTEMQQDAATQEAREA